MVECQLPKLKVASSSLVTRSTLIRILPTVHVLLVANLPFPYLGAIELDNVSNPVPSASDLPPLIIIRL